MKVFQIDSERQEVIEHTVEKLDLPTIYRLVGCDTFCLGPDIGPNQTFVDDNGLLKNENFFFGVHGVSAQPFAGNALVIGPPNAEGDSTEAKGTREQVLEQIEFLGKGQIG